MHAFQIIPVDQLVRGRFQPRQHFDEEALLELGQSILTQGLIEPLVVQPFLDGRFEIIAGERRWRAAILKGIHELPCVIGQYTDAQVAAMTLVENIQREALNLIEEAQGYQRLLTDFGFLQEDVANLVGKSRSHIANLLRLLTLAPDVQAQIRQGGLSLGHARMLVGLPVAAQRQLAQKVVQQGWSVRKLEQEVRAQRTTALTKERDPDLARLTEALSMQLGAPVVLDEGGDEGGWLRIKYFDAETLEGLLDRLGLRYDD